jgi:ribosome-binding protein aMBF1 (putative translation factor)
MTWFGEPIQPLNQAIQSGQRGGARTHSTDTCKKRYSSRMPRSIPALVKPALLVWARERSGLTVEAAAAKMQLDADLLRDWESGSARPTIAQVRKLGDVYKRPLAVFFLPQPPRGFRAMKLGVSQARA